MKTENKMGTKTGKMGGKQVRESQEDSCKKDRMGGGNFAKQEYNSKLTLKNAMTKVGKFEVKNWSEKGFENPGGKCFSRNFRTKTQTYIWKLFAGFL